MRYCPKCGIENDEDLDLVFVFGMGGGYLINAVRKLNVSVAVIEPDINFFNTLIMSICLADSFSLPFISNQNCICLKIHNQAKMCGDKCKT